MRRRSFMNQVGRGLALSALPAELLRNHSFPRIDSFRSNAKPLAMAMWDFSWLLRKYRKGGFEDWNKALDELQERGYNALRIEAFPHFIAHDDNGIRQEEYFLPKNDWRPALWGNEISVTISPLQSLIQFLTLCEKRQIKIALSSWFYGHGTQRNRGFTGIDGLVRAWNETLQLLKEKDLLKNVMYVDLLNEYPLWHGYAWLRSELERSGTLQFQPFDFLNAKGTKLHNDEQINTYNEFIQDVIRRLKDLWPDLKFCVSQTNTLNTPWVDLEVSSFDVLDIHLWLVYHPEFSRYTEYFSNIHPMRNDLQFEKTNRLILEYWHRNKSVLVQWLEGAIVQRKRLAARLDVPLGNSEGWGTVMWKEHPALDWTFIKEAGLIAAELGAKHGYAFNCSSNFTHPHFRDLWADIDWHKEVTKIIRKQ